MPSSSSRCRCRVPASNRTPLRAGAVPLQGPLRLVVDVVVADQPEEPDHAKFRNQRPSNLIQAPLESSMTGS